MIRRRYILVIAAIIAIFGAVLLARQLPAGNDPTSRDRTAEEFRTALRATPRAKHEPLFAAYLDRLGTDVVLDVLENEHSLCHSQAHPLGRAVFAQTRDVNQAIAACGNRCTGGCFHGVLMAAFQDFATIDPNDPDDHVEFEEVLRHAKTICDDPATSNVHRRGNCAHGIGHALTFLAGYRVAEAVAACRLFEELPLQYYCASGAYMERDIVHGATDAELPSRLAPCNQEQDFPAACFRYKSKYLARRSLTLEDEAATCLGLERRQRLGCFHGLGFAHLEMVARRGSTLVEICRFGDLDDQKICIEGAIEKLADYDPRRANAACKALAPDLRTHCLDAVSLGLYSLEKPFELYLPESPNVNARLP